MGLLDVIDITENQIETPYSRPVQETSNLLENTNTLIIDATTLEPIIKKFSFLTKNKQLEDQLVKMFCINGTLFVCASNLRYFYATMIEDIQMSKTPFEVHIPYKQLVTIIKAANKQKSQIEIKVQDNILITTNKTKWELPILVGDLDIKTLMNYYEIDTFNDTVSKQALLEILKMFYPFVNKSDETLIFNENYVFCRSNHFYIWTGLILSDNYILNKENIKLITTFEDTNDPNINILSTEDKLILKCKNDLLVTDRIDGNVTLLPEIAKLQTEQSMVLLKKPFSETLKEIDIYPTRNLTITLEEGGLRLLNRANDNGTAETLIEVDKQFNKVNKSESYNISYDILEECLQCIKEDIVELISLNMSEYVQLRTPTLNCLLMVNY